MRTEILRMERVTTIENEVMLLDNFNLHIFQGEIMGLVSINENGKESLIRLISQNVPIHYGRVYFNEALVNNYQHSTLTMNKVAVIEQKSRLIEDLTVADNVFVLRRGFRKYFLSTRMLNGQLRRVTRELGIRLDGGELVSSLSPFAKYLVELLRAVIMGAKLVVIRDISNSVSTADLVKLHSLIRYYSEKGLSFLYICSHHEEAFKICSRVSLMRDGKIIKVFDQNEFQNENMMPYYVGEFETVVREKVLRHSENPILSFRGVCTDTMDHLTFSVAKGECTVLLDLDNTVLNDLVCLMNGELRQSGGEILYRGVPYRHAQARRALQNGVAFIAENPVQSMLFPEMTYLDNLCFLLDKKEGRMWLTGRDRRSVMREYGPIIGDDIGTQDITGLKLQSLYDLVYYRVHLFNPGLVFCVQPFAGADMYLRRRLIELINQLKKKGITVVILAVNIADSLVIADRLIRIEKGRFSSEYPRSEFYHFRADGILI